MRGAIILRAGMAVSLLALYFSGLGQMPVYQRYYITEIPGLGWTAQYYLTLQIHYIFAVVLIFLYTFQLFSSHRRGEPVFTEPPKRSAGNFRFVTLLRLSRTFIHLNLILLIGSGIIKVIKNLPTVTLSYPLLVTVTALHNLATVLLLVSFAAYFLARFLQNKKAPAATRTV